MPLRPLDAVLAGLAPETETVYLVGDRPADGWVSWSLTAPGAGWSAGEHYHDTAHPVMRYIYAKPGRQRPRPDEKRRVAIMPAGAWFAGAPSYTADDARNAWHVLGALIRSAFDGGTLLATPATTGRELFLRTIPADREWPVLPVELRELFWKSGQARVETFPMPWEIRRTSHKRAPGLYEYDGRLMYAALCWGLPAGIPERGKGWPEPFDPYAGGRYRVRVTVPADWPHAFGLVGLWDDDGAGGWNYPAEPRRQFETWCDGAELHLMIEQGWPVEVVEHVVFPRYRGKGPLDEWARKLAELHRAVTVSPHRAGPERVRADLLRAALRSLVLHGIGAFHTSGHTVTRIVDAPELVPAEHRRHVRRDGGRFLWPEHRPARWHQLSHPEWSSAIWARARRRLIDAPAGAGALQAAGNVVAFSTDAIYLTQRQTNWFDDGKPGRFRLKRWTAEPIEWPANRTALLRLRATLPHRENGI